MTLVLREEIDLLELQLAEVVLAYLDHLEARGELDLETATEFIVLVAALLELKSRLMLTGDEDEQLLDIEPAEAAEELLTRMLDARRYRSAATHLRELLAAQDGVRFRSAPPPAHLLRAVPAPIDGVLDPAALGQALGRLLVMPPAISLRHITDPARVARRAPLAPALAAAPRALHLRGGRRRRRRSHDRRDHRVRAFGALQTRRSGLGAERVLRRDPRPCARPAGFRRGGRRVSEPERRAPLLDRSSRRGLAASDHESRALPALVEALLFLSSDPLSIRELADAAGADELEIAAAVGLLAEQYAPGLRGIQLRELAGGYALASDPACEEAARRLFSRPRAAALTPAQAETLAIVAYLQPVSRPEITRIRGVSADSAATTLLERGLIEEAGRSQFGAVLYRTGTQFLKLFGLRSLSELPDVAQWDPTPEEQAELRERLLRAGRGARRGRAVAAGGVIRQPSPPAGRTPRRCRARA